MTVWGKVWVSVMGLRPPSARNGVRANTHAHRFERILKMRLWCLVKKENATMVKPVKRLDGNTRTGHPQQGKNQKSRARKKQLYHLASAKCSTVTDEAKAKVHAFTERTDIDRMAGYQPPKIVCTNQSQINEYGWAAKFPEWNRVHCITPLHPKSETRLLRPRCLSKLVHVIKLEPFVVAKNALINRFY